MSSLGGLALIPTMNLLIDKSSLRWGLIASGGFYAVILLPLCYWFRNRPEDMGLQPDGATRPPATRSGRAAAAPRQTRDYTTREALRTQAYWLLLLGAGLRQTATLGILVSLFPILVDDKGMSTQMAANLIGVMSLINFVSRLALGFLGDRISKKGIMFFSLTVEGIGYLFLWLGDWQTAVGISLVLGFILCEGMMDGAGVIVWAALGEYYGRTRFATLRGYITFAYAWALVASPVYAGWVGDRLCHSAICAFAAGATTSGVCHHPRRHLRLCGGTGFVLPLHQTTSGVGSLAEPEPASCRLERRAMLQTSLMISRVPSQPIVVAIVTHNPIP